MNVQITYPLVFTQHTNSNKTSDVLLLPFINTYHLFIYVQAYVYHRYKYKQFRKKYNYSQLKEIHSNLKEALDNINICSECGQKHENWLTKKLSLLYTEMLEMLESKRQQEDEFLTDLLEGFKEVQTKLRSPEKENLSKMNRLLENELQDRQIAYC